MDSVSAFAMGMANQHKPPMVFDWNKAARLIREHKPLVASAGLRSDWEWTGGEIFRGEKPVDKEEAYTYSGFGSLLSSTWAIPEIDLDGDVQDCYVMQSEQPEWNSDTWWPESALRILGGEND